MPAPQADEDLGDDQYPNDHDLQDDPEQALTPCPHCSQMIHEEAPRCPHCGTWLIEESPAARRSQGWLWPALIAIMVILAALGWRLLR
jgi:uncharacterized paraquat-inducible protein A